AQYGDALLLRERDELIDRRARSVGEPIAVVGSRTFVSGAVAVPVADRITEQGFVAILNSGGERSGRQSRFREAGLAADRVETHIDENVDALHHQRRDEVIEGTTFVADRDNSGRHAAHRTRLSDVG